MIEIEEGATKVLYSPITYTLATEEAERIGMDHIARVSIAGAKESSAGMGVYVHMCICVCGSYMVKCINCVWALFIQLILVQ